MRINMRATFAMLLIVAAVSAVPASAQTHSVSSAKPGTELALTYTYLHAKFAYPVKRSFSAVAEAGAVTASNVNSSGRDLTLSSYLVGGRYSLRAARFTPYAQLLVGAAHASGSLAPGQFGLSSTAFAMAAGGGLDLNLHSHLALRVFQADYLLTLLPNQTNDHQNNFRFSTGVVFHFGNK
jgi:peptidoglycan-associated lipoprotein